MATISGRSRAVALCGSLALTLWALPGTTAAAQATVGLGTAGSYAVLAGTTVTNTGPSTVTASLGVSPGTAVTGFPPGIVSNGSIHAADAAALNAQAALTTAFNDAAGRSTTGAISADLAGQTLTTGVYTGGALALSGTLTLDAQGDPSAVFVFQAASTLTTGSSSRVSLINGADACNVFWVIGSSATIGTGSNFVGTVLALTSISAQTNATIHGRLLARNGQVSLDSNAFTVSSCRTGAATSTSTGAGGTLPGTPASIPGTGGASNGILPAAALLVIAGAAVTIAVRRRTVVRRV
jgi:hypothetical protein